MKDYFLLLVLCAAIIIIHFIQVGKKAVIIPGPIPPIKGYPLLIRKNLRTGPHPTQPDSAQQKTIYETL